MLTLAILGVVVASHTSFAQDAPAGSNLAPKIVAPVTSQTVEKIQGGEKAQYSFEIRNEGAGVLRILQVQPSCGCTVASFPPSIAPGGKGTIAATVQTNPLWNNFTKTLDVRTNDPATPNLVFSLVGTVVPAYTVSPAPGMIVPYEKPEPITEVFTIQSHRPDFALRGPTALSGPVTARVEPAPGQAETWKVTMTVTPPESRGTVSGEITLETGLAKLQPIRLTVTALGEKGITVSPQEISFGTFNGSQSAVRSASLYSRKTVFHVTRVESDDPALTVTYTALPLMAGWYNVQITYNGGWSRGIHHGAVRLYTDVPTIAVVKVGYEGEVE